MKVVFTCYIFEFHTDFCKDIAEEVRNRGGEVVFARQGETYDNVDFTIQPDEAYPRFGGKGVFINHAMPILPQCDFWLSDTFKHAIRTNSDVIFAPSKEWAEWYKIYELPVYVTGFPRLDKVFNTLRPDGTVVYAPTHHLKPGVYSGSQFDVNEVKRFCLELGYKDFIYRGHPAYNKSELTFEECYRRASVFISDYSSVGLEAITLNMPTILIGNARWLNVQYDHISNKSDEAAMRVYTLDHLKNALIKYKENPDHLRNERIEYSKRLCEFQGKAAKKMVDVMEALL